MTLQNQADTSHTAQIDISALGPMMELLAGAFTQLASDGLTLLNAISMDISSDEQVAQRIELADELYMVADEQPELAQLCVSFAEMILKKVEEYEEDIELPMAAPREILALLMKQHDVKQKDLSGIAGQSTISEILSGKRDITKQQAISLAAFFKLPADTFL